ncbi:unnamed protein product, partial [Microthlaspi erraticum]
MRSRDRLRKLRRTSRRIRTVKRKHSFDTLEINKPSRH